METDNTKSLTGCIEKKSGRGITLPEKEQVARAVFLALAAFSVFAVFAIVFYLFYASIPAFYQVGFFQFVFGIEWSASHDLFGILPMIATSFVLTLLAVGLGGTFAVFTAVFIVFYCPRAIKKAYVQMINLLAGIPSLVYGYFGLSLLAPLFEDIFGVGSSSGLLLSTTVLALMILPTITALVKNSLENVPMHYYEGALGLGCTKNQAVFRVLLPASKNGIIAAFVLGIGRAVGETMAVQLLLGNQVNFPIAPFLPVRSLTSNIVQEFGYSAGLHRQALIATGFILLLFVLAINFSLAKIKKNNAVAGNKFFSRKIKEGNQPGFHPNFKKTGSGQDVLWIISLVVSAIVVLLLLLIIFFVFVRGLPNLTPEFLFGKSTSTRTTLVPAFVTTLMLICIALVVALPLGIGAAIYLNEYSKRDSKVVKVIRLFIDTLAGIPSIVFGLFGAIFFGTVLGMGYSVLNGAFTLSIMILPTIIRSVEQALAEVPDSMREASYALGAGKLRTVFVVVLPQAISGVVTSIILSIGRIVGESAALIYTSGIVSEVPQGVTSPGASFALFMYKFMVEGMQVKQCYATAAILMIFVIVLNFLVSLVEYLFRKKKAA